MTDPSPRRTDRIVAGAWIVALAAAMTLMNAVKPLHMDDSIYHAFARRIAASPGDPYGGEVVDYWAAPRPSTEVLAPVFLPYLWSRAILVHGDDPALCKLWLAPFCLMLAWSAWSLGRRFARGFEASVAGLVAFSPAVLPSLNYMLDVPALALGLVGLVLFFRAVDRGSSPMAVAAGLVAGASIGTKWTGLVFPATMGLHALIRRRVGLGLAAGLAAALVFVGWEAWIARAYGESHFLLHSGRKGGTSLMDRLNGAKALTAILGGVAPAVLATGLLALRRPIAAGVAGAFSLAGYVAVGLGLAPLAAFLPIGVLLAVNLATIAAVLLIRRGRQGAGRGRWRWRGDRDDAFLVAWLALEVAAFFVLSPYSAVRRVLGVVVAATLLAARLASRTCRTPSRREAVRWSAFAGMVLGVAYYGVDLWEARVERRAAEESAAAALARVEPGRTAWFAGRWGFRDHAERAGLVHIAPGRTVLEPGDLLVVHDNKVDLEPTVDIDPSLVEEVLRLQYDDNLPYRLVPPFYAGKEPIQKQSGPRFVAHVYQVSRRFTPLGWVRPEFGPRDRPVGALMRAGRGR